MPICLPRTTEQLANLRIGDQMTVAGWGKMNMTTEERADVLQVVGVSTQYLVVVTLTRSFKWFSITFVWNLYLEGPIFVSSE